MSATLTNNVSESCYELDLGDAIAVADYVHDDNVLQINHVGVPRSHQNQGIASRLMHDMLADVRRHGLKIRPVCGFAKAYFRRHPEEGDLLA